MTKIAYLDCFSGIAGDMLLAAMVDAGLPQAYLTEQIGTLAIHEPYQLRFEETRKGSLRALRFFVEEHEHEHAHEDKHAHEDARAHNHAETAHAHGQHRHLSEIEALIDNSGLTARAKSIARLVFLKLAEAEAKVHGSRVEEVHFHEVGALDSIVDVVGAAVGLDYFGIERLYASDLPFTSGHIHSQHGIIPVPAPAVLALLEAVHAPLRPVAGRMELVTPTGAAIVAALAAFERPAMRLEKVGVGAGKKDLEWPNILRLMIGSPAEEKRPLILLETNIDDMNPELYAPVMDALFQAGALDVFLSPIYMKKNRPAVKLSVIARKENEAALAGLILRQTSTFGLRVLAIERHEAEREMRQVSTVFGEVGVKVKILDGKACQVSPEYEDCARLSKERGVAAQDVYLAALRAAESLLRG